VQEEEEAVSESLDKLRVLTEHLPALADITKRDVSGFETRGEIEYRMERGTCIGWFVYRDDNVAVQRAFLSKDALFPRHAHEDVAETICVYEGRLVVAYEDGESKEAGPGESVYIERGAPHSVQALEDTWTIGITVPAIEGYPRE